jgi:hypothetical protein
MVLFLSFFVFPVLLITVDHMSYIPMTAYAELIASKQPEKHVIKLIDKRSSQLIGQFGHVTASAVCKQPEKHLWITCPIELWITCPIELWIRCPIELWITCPI